MKFLMFYFLIFATLFISSCSDKKSEPILGNPPAPGFNAEASDAKAIAVSDEIMEAMGGRKAWDDTQYFSWTFFGNRKHIWDKHNQKCRIESPRDELTILMDLKNQTGRVKKGDEEYTAQDSLDKYLDLGNRWWINDSYWLVMPFKLKDSGVTLKYIGKDTTETGRSADVLELTFADVGVTPDNKYLVYVDDSSRLVTQWDYYTNYQDSLPRFKSPWPQYSEYGALFLSGGAIGDRRITDISVSPPATNALEEF